MHNVVSTCFTNTKSVVHLGGHYVHDGPISFQNVHRCGCATGMSIPRKASATSIHDSWHGAIQNRLCLQNKRYSLHSCGTFWFSAPISWDDAGLPFTVPRKSFHVHSVMSASMRNTKFITHLVAH